MREILREELMNWTKEAGIWQVPRDFDINKDFYDKGILKGETLVHGHYYLGKCRNAIIGRWNEETKEMFHIRSKFGNNYVDKVNYLDNDNNFDLFIAMRELTAYEVSKINKIKFHDEKE